VLPKPEGQVVKRSLNIVDICSASKEIQRAFSASLGAPYLPDSEKFEHF